MDFDRICELKTPASVRCLTMTDHRGMPVVVVVARLGFRVSPWGSSKLKRAPVRITSTWWGKYGSLRYTGDWAAHKPGTDVVMIATATPPPTPPNPPITQMDVSLRIGPLQKLLRVYGPRVYYQGVIGGVVPGPPARMDPTPIQYENAYGGRESGAWDPRNPAGIGFAVDRTQLIGKPAPVIEDMSIALPARLSTPAGFGPIAPDWEPRRTLAGTYDETWAKERAPVPPHDQDPRHACFSPHGLWSQKPLLGDEPVEVLGATPEGAWRFRLPRYEPEFAVTIRGQRRELQTHLDTFYIDAEERKVELTWRTTIPIPRKRELIERIEMTGKDPLPDSLFTEAGYQPPALEVSA